MRTITKAAAAITVAGALVLGPLFTGFIAGPESALESSVAKPLRQVDLSANWSSDVFHHLSGRRVPMEVADLLGLIRMVDATSRRFHLNPLMVLAVIHVESGFNPYAVSPAGSVGLMQLQLETARDIAARLGLPWTSDDRLFEPEFNVLLGTFYLKQMLDRFGDFDLALAAFHVGPTRLAANNRRPGPASMAYADRVWNALLDLQSSARA